MRYKSLFRVLVKVIGVAMVATAAVTILKQAAIVFYYMFISGSGGFQSGGASYFYMFNDDGLQEYLLAELTSPIIQLTIGFLLFFRSNWIANLAIPSNRPYCVECGYDLTGHAAEKCPECGTAKPNGDMI